MLPRWQQPSSVAPVATAAAAPAACPRGTAAPSGRGGRLRRSNRCIETVTGGGAARLRGCRLDVTAVPGGDRCGAGRRLRRRPACVLVSGELVPVESVAGWNVSSAERLAAQLTGRPADVGGGGAYLHLAKVSPRSRVSSPPRCQNK